MFIKVLESVLVMSFAGGALSVFWICLKPVTRRVFSPKWQYYIWLTVLAVMILPVSFSISKNIPETWNIVQVQKLNEVEAETIKTAQEDEVSSPIVVYTEPKIIVYKSIMQCLSIVWLCGAILFLSVRLAKYLMFLKTIHKSSIEDNAISGIPGRLRVRRTHTLDAPLIVGLVKPVLYLPDMELSEEDMNYILMHELTHYKRHDILYKWAAMLIGSIHWFNPLMYAVLKQIDLECEVSCDFAVASKLTKEEQNSYMNMILDMLNASRNNLRLLTTQMASSKKILKRRFEMIRNNKRTGRLVSAISIATAAVMLSTAVFASSTLSELTDSQYVITVKSSGEEINFVDGAFVENNVTYVPLKAALEKLGTDSKVEWDDGQVYSYITKDGQERVYSIKIGSDVIGVSTNNETTKNVNIVTDEKSVPMLKNDVTYVPFNYVDYMLKPNDVALDAQDKNDAEADTKAEYEITVGTYTAYEVQESDSMPSILKGDNSGLIKASIEECLKKSGYNLPYTYELKYQKYNDDNNTVEFYIELKPESSDSYDYLTIIFSHNGEIWEISDYYLEK